MSRSKILFLMTGSIACYKACHVISRLVQDGHSVQVVTSHSALQFIGAATLEGLTGRPVLSDLWERGRAMDHIHLIREADLVLAAPASAHFINRIAHGVGDDLLTTLFLANDFRQPFLVAPAMNTSMYVHPATQRSLGLLREMGVQILETASGVLACGETGYGKLLDPELILAEAHKALGKNSASSTRPPPRSTREGRSILITAGGTSEKVDEVRVLTNTSTGRSGARLADFLDGLGHTVTLLRSERGAHAESANVRQMTFSSYQDLSDCLRGELQRGEHSHVVQLAAVSDYSVDQVIVDGLATIGGKTPSGHDVSLRLRPTKKLIAELKSWSPRPVHIAGFKLTVNADESQRRDAVNRVLEYAELVIQNDVSEIDETVGTHPYRAYTRTREERLSGFAEMSARIAEWILESDKERETL